MSVTHRGEGVEEIVESPGDDDNVVDVQPEGKNHSCQPHSCKWRQRAASIQVSSDQLRSWVSQQVLWQSQKKQPAHQHSTRYSYTELVRKGGLLPHISQPPFSTGWAVLPFSMLQVLQGQSSMKSGSDHFPSRIALFHIQGISKPPLVSRMKLLQTHQHVHMLCLQLSHTVK